MPGVISRGDRQFGLMILDGCDRFPQIEGSEEFNRALLDFLRRRFRMTTSPTLI
jgi:pimeloyl-ACP methyl ester carboxylesterase